MERQKIFRWILILLSGLACLLLFVPFLKEILLAAFFAFALSPLTRYLRTKGFFSRRGWIGVTLIGLILAIILPIALLFYSTYGLLLDLSSEGFQQSDFYSDLVQSKTVAIQWVNDLLDAINLREKVDLTAMTNHFLSGIGTKIVSFSTSLASQLPDLVLSLFIFGCALYLFLAEGRKIQNLLSENQLLPELELDRLIPSIQKSCYATLVGSILVGGVQGLSVGVGSFVLGSKHVFLISLFTFVSSFIPVLGAAPVALFLGFVSLVKGNYVIAIGYVIVAIFAGTIDNIIRPWLVRGEQNIHSIVMLFAIIGGIVALGLPGLFLGPMFISVAVDIFSLYVFIPQKPKAVIEQDF